MSQGALDELAPSVPADQSHPEVRHLRVRRDLLEVPLQHKLFINIKADDAEAQVGNGLLWIRSPSTMLGYLNVDALFDDAGWIYTGWVRIRASDLINVGGEKVVPAEVESCILELDFVIDATVHGETNPLMGMMVVADVPASAVPT